MQASTSHSGSRRGWGVRSLTGNLVKAVRLPPSLRKSDVIGTPKPWDMRNQPKGYGCIGREGLRGGSKLGTDFVSNVTSGCLLTILVTGTNYPTVGTPPDRELTFQGLRCPPIRYNFTPQGTFTVIGDQTLMS